MDANIFLNGECLICDRDMSYSNKTYNCPNGCCEYTLNFVANAAKVNINFDKNSNKRSYIIPSTSDRADDNLSIHLNEGLKLLKSRIAYWKEDYRYLAEILERS